MKALLLAAGRGTRLRPITDRIPKPLIQVWGKPILEHVLRGLALTGIREAGIVIGHLGEQIEEYFGDGSALGLSIRYFRQTEKPGTAGAVLAARSFLEGAPFFMSFGDILVDQRMYSGILADFAAHPCAAEEGLNWVEDPSAGAAVYVEGSRIVRIIEKPPPGTSTTHWNQAGIFVFGPEALEAMGRISPSPRGEYEITSAIQLLLEDGKIVRGYPFPKDTFWSDVGTPEELDRLAGLTGTPPSPVL